MSWLDRHPLAEAAVGVLVCVVAVALAVVAFVAFVWFFLAVWRWFGLDDALIRVTVKEAS